MRLHIERQITKLTFHDNISKYYIYYDNYMDDRTCSILHFLMEIEMGYDEDNVRMLYYFIIHEISYYMFIE